MLYHQLNKIRGQLSRKELSVSDGLLLTLKALRGHLPEAKLTWLNLELLGYRPQDLEALNQDHLKTKGLYKIVLLWSAAKPNNHQIERPPSYRFLQGAWGKLDEMGRLNTVSHLKGLSEKSIFCNIGLTQLEAQLEEMEDPMAGLFSMSLDQESGLEFYCFSKELVRIQEAVRTKLCHFIDDAIEELQLQTSQE